MSAGMTLALNGRFTGARQTGVQRVARNLVQALDARLSAANDSDVSAELLLPRDTRHGLELREVRIREVGRLKGNAWEQLELPVHSRNVALVNFCNVAPLCRDSAVTMIHDAQVYLNPASYTRQFVDWYKFALPRIAARSRRVLTVSNYSKRMLAEVGVAPAEKIEVLYNGVDHVFRIEPEPGAVGRFGLEHRPYVLMFANYQAHKNIRVVLEAFNRPALKQLSLVLVGEVDARGLEEKLGCVAPPNVVYAGRAADPALRALIEGAVCLAYPSLSEGFGLPPLEAMLLGCPAVVAPTGSLPEVCGAAALYADVDDPDGWAEALSTLARDSSKRADMVQRGRAQAGRFTWSAGAERLQAVLTEVCR